MHTFEAHETTTDKNATTVLTIESENLLQLHHPASTALKQSLKQRGRTRKHQDWLRNDHKYK